MDNIWSTGDFAGMGGLECDEVLDPYEDPCLKTGGLINYQMSPLLSPRMSPPKMSPGVVGQLAQSHRPAVVMTDPALGSASPSRGRDRLDVWGPGGRTPPPTTTRRDALGRRCAHPWLLVAGFGVCFPACS
jgi:hypothetical protein